MLPLCNSFPSSTIPLNCSSQPKKSYTHDLCTYIYIYTVYSIYIYIFTIFMFSPFGLCVCVSKPWGPFLSKPRGGLIVESSVTLGRSYRVRYTENSPLPPKRKSTSCQTCRPYVRCDNPLAQSKHLLAIHHQGTRRRK